MSDRTIEQEGPRLSRLAVSLLAGAAAALVGAGLVMWAAFGPAVFSDVVLAAVAWCF